MGMCGALDSVWSRAIGGGQIFHQVAVNVYIVFKVMKLCCRDKCKIVLQGQMQNKLLQKIAQNLSCFSGRPS